jgi:DNA-binding CsgD family transcriptional regulator
MLDGRGSLVLISGEAGIGKTALVEDLVRHALGRGASVLTGNSYDMMVSAPYGPWLDAFRHLPVDATLPPCPLISYGNATDIEAESQADLFLRMRDFIDALAAHQPLVCVLEDLHWADQASLDLLRDIARHVRSARLLLVVTWRADELTRRHPLRRFAPTVVREAGGVRVELKPLDAAAHRALLTTRYVLAVDDVHRLVDYLARRADGNPFFMTELLRTLEDNGVLKPTDHGAWMLGDLDRVLVPDMVRQVVDARVDRLGSGAREMLEVAAVIGQEVPLDLWADLIDVEDDRFASDIESMVRSCLLREASTHSYAFSHAIVRDALYTGVVLPRRRMLHRSVAELLAARVPSDPDRVAHHFDMAGDPRSATWLLRAGIRARQQFAPHSAIKRFTGALSRYEHLTGADRIRAHLERGRAYETVGDYTSAVADAEAARDLARQMNEPKLEWQTLLDLGSDWAARDYEQSGTHYRHALDLARAMGDPAALAATLNQVGNWSFNVLQIQNAIAFHREALEILEDQDDVAGIAQTHDYLALAWLGYGDMIQASEHWDAAISLFERIGDRRRHAGALSASATSSHVGFTIFAPHSLARGFERNARGLEMARDVGWRAGEVFAMHIQAGLLALDGDIARALDVAHQVIALSEAIDHREWRVAGWYEVGEIALSIQDLHAARAAFERAFSLVDLSGSAFWRRLAASSLAETLIRVGEIDAAHSLLNAEFGTFDPIAAVEPGWNRAQERIARAALALARGDTSGALAIIDATVAALPNTDQGLVPHWSLLRGRVLVALDRLTEALDEFVAARDVLAAHGERPRRLIACCEVSRIYAALGRRIEAERAAHEARELAEYISARLPDDTSRVNFHSSISALLTDAAPKRRTAGGLSAREVEVLRLVAEGLTDAEVADRLYLSRRTVSSHLRSIYTKLAVSTRTAAVRLAIERGII